MQKGNKTILYVIKLVKFGLVGGGVTLLGILGYYICLDLYKFPLYPTYIALNILATALTYLLNSKYTFKQKVEVSKSVKYFITYALGITFGIFLLWVLEQIVSFRPFILVLMVIPLRVLLTFFISDKLVFVDNSDQASDKL